MVKSHKMRLAFLLCSSSLLAACADGANLNFLKKNSDSDGAEVSSLAAPSTSSVKLVERDIEAPEVFQISDKGLWDGRPSLGGVWIAHSSVTEPERVIIRNEDNGKFVIGALFKRERDNPGPALQISSDAASALGMLAGAPDQLNVTALRRQEVPIADDAPVVAGSEILPAAATVETATLDPISAASAALDKVESTGTTTLASAAPAPTVAKPAPAPSTKLDKAFIQIGLFSVKQNADNTGVAMRNAGMLPTIQQNESRGKTYYRVTVGPATSTSERAALLKKIKGLGYSDAYFVRN